MAKLHELLAAEKTPAAAWNAMIADTLKKFKNPSTFFDGHSRSLAMISDAPENKALEDAAREEKAVHTSVHDTLDYALDVWCDMEDLQYQKNETNRVATGVVMWDGEPLTPALPVDELLGLEARLGKIRELVLAAPTLDASKYWVRNPQQGQYVWELQYPEETTKTEKTLIPVIMAPADEHHPAQVQPVPKDTVIGKFTTVKRSGALTAEQKAYSIKQIDRLIREVKQARMRANDTEAVNAKIAELFKRITLEPMKL